MSQERNTDSTENWEDFVFPGEVFETSPLQRELEEVFHRFGLSSLSEVKPDSSLRKKILSHVLNQTSKEENFLFVRKSDSPWKNSAFPGVEYKILNKDKTRNTVTLVIRMKAGAVFPGHSHGSGEDCFLISGDLNIAGTILHAGDFHRANAGSVHKKFSTSSGAEFLIVSGASDFAESEKYFS
ncbi:cupin domain-containing protein [Leptospira sp. 201903071]|uniref:cupin domain-containing protein n=1 Tax=Leptospira ainazelensis TaxID=2810034 RepID=UPI00196636F8|nr:cupin domain-containing protein [Leptospira ainazelensis]MBM9500451.1 cupin domain-containing protein [Leptospira ainazelensis]